MSNEELCKEIQNGNRELLSKLIEQNERIIHRIARYYLPVAIRNRGADIDDLTQAATLGMLIAVSHWDEARGGFLTIAVPYMRKEVRRLLGLHTEKLHIENTCTITLLSSPTSYDDELEIIQTVEDYNAVDPQESACTSNMREIVRESVQALPQEQREAVTTFYLQGKPAGSINIRQRKKGMERLSRASRILALKREYLAQTDRRGGLYSFRYTHTSSVEYAVMQRERIRQQLQTESEASNERTTRSGNPLPSIISVISPICFDSSVTSPPNPERPPRNTYRSADEARENTRTKQGEPRRRGDIKAVRKP